YNLLSNMNLIKYSTEECGIGSILSISGFLSVIDMATIKDIWSNPTMRKMSSDQAAKDAGIGPGRQARKAIRDQNKSIDAAFDLLTTLPHLTAATLIEGDVKVWGTLRREGLITPPEELAVKYGHSISGQWTMLGIIDSAPDETSLTDDSVPPEDSINDDGQTISVTLDGENSLAKLAKFLSATARRLMGRPSDHFGITPLIISRSIPE
ncbi:MAG: hypothetical protein ABF968_05840, partial [Acetobacter sp.]|uniref:hypothetical protein n=1 Tax=Acetobacter sp. TaxID=440 RepID=UPI0039E90035